MVIDREGDIVTIHLPERCEGKFSRELFEEISKDQFKEVSKVVLDFKDVRFADSSTIGILVTIDRKFKSLKVSLSLKNLNSEIMELFTDTGLDILFNIETDGRVHEATVDLFEAGVDIRLEVDSETQDEICILHLSGVMNHPVGSRYFKQQFLLALAHHKKILLDFENLTFFDSLSVSVALSMHKLLKETGGSLRFCNANYIVNDLFMTLNIDQIIPVFKTIEDAMADWN